MQNYVVDLNVNSQQATQEERNYSKERKKSISYAIDHHNRILITVKVARVPSEALSLKTLTLDPGNTHIA